MVAGAADVTCVVLRTSIVGLATPDPFRGPLPAFTHYHPSTEDDR